MRYVVTLLLSCINGRDVFLWLFSDDQCKLLQVFVVSDVRVHCLPDDLCRLGTKFLRPFDVLLLFRLDFFLLPTMVSASLIKLKRRRL